MRGLLAGHEKDAVLAFNAALRKPAAEETKRAFVKPMPPLPGLITADDFFDGDPLCAHVILSFRLVTGQPVALPTKAGSGAGFPLTDENCGHPLGLGETNASLPVRETGDEAGTGGEPAAGTETEGEGSHGGAG